MVLNLIRKAQKPYYTIGKLYVDGKYFCDTLEPTVRILGPNGEGKVKGKTAIPQGEYKVSLQYSMKYGRNMPRLLNVPFFNGILIHWGNTAADTQGCILVGKNRAVGKVLDSKVTFNALWDVLRNSERSIKIVVE